MESIRSRGMIVPLAVGPPIDVKIKTNLKNDTDAIKLKRLTADIRFNSRVYLVCFMEGEGKNIGKVLQALLLLENNSFIHS